MPTPIGSALRGVGDRRLVPPQLFDDSATPFRDLKHDARSISLPTGMLLSTRSWLIESTGRYLERLQSRLMQWNKVGIHATYSMEEALPLIDSVEPIF